MAIVIVVSGLYMTITEGTQSTEVLRSRVDCVELDEPNVSIVWNMAARGDFSRVADFNTTTVNGQSATSGAELKDLLLNTIYMASDYFTEVALGNVPNHTSKPIFAYTPDIDTATEIIWQETGTFIPLSVGQRVHIVSTVADDKPGGSGLETVTLEGVDDSGELLTVSYDLNGTVDVTTDESWLGVNIIFGTSAGSTQAAVGKITVRGTTDGNTIASILIGQSISQQAIYYVPNGHTLLIYDVHVTAGKDGGGTQPEIITTAYYIIGGVKISLTGVLFDTATDNSGERKNKPPIAIPAGAYWALTATTDKNDTVVRADISQILVAD